ncbi:MAG: hypothetical protein LBC61_01970 [Candidatus Peribacteria bacterium]|nr:hypothetical protein [Candidatus Peribacteria bacterium]
MTKSFSSSLSSRIIVKSSSNELHHLKSFTSFVTISYILFMFVSFFVAIVNISFSLSNP